MKLRKCEGGRLAFFCPGCDAAHVLPMEKDIWDWNRSMSAPTFDPSISVRFGGDPSRLCHSFIREGKIMFLADSTHALAGQTVPLLEWE